MTLTHLAFAKKHPVFYNILNYLQVLGRFYVEIKTIKITTLHNNFILLTRTYCYLKRLKGGK